MRIRKLRGTAILNIYTYYRYIHTIHAYTVYIIRRLHMYACVKKYSFPVTYSEESSIVTKMSHINVCKPMFQYCQSKAIWESYIVLLVSYTIPLLYAPSLRE